MVGALVNNFHKHQVPSGHRHDGLHVGLVPGGAVTGTLEGLTKRHALHRWYAKTQLDVTAPWKCAGRILV